MAKKRKFTNGQLLICRQVSITHGGVTRYVGRVVDEFPQLGEVQLKLRYTNRVIPESVETFKYSDVSVIPVLPGSVVMMGLKSATVAAYEDGRYIIPGYPKCSVYPRDVVQHSPVRVESFMYADGRIWLYGDEKNALKTLDERNNAKYTSGDSVLPFGGLSQVAIKLINKIPPHVHYVSPFAGKDAVFRKISRAKHSILSDINPLVHHWWLNDYLPVNESDLELYRTRKIQVVKKDFREVINYKFIRDFCSEQPVFMLLNPPYPPHTRLDFIRHQYDNELTEADHVELLDCVVELSGRCPNVRIMLLTNNNAIYSDKLKGWHTFDCKSMSRGGLQIVQVFCNYETDVLHDYRFTGKNADKRKKLREKADRLIVKLNRHEPTERAAIIQKIVEHFKIAI